MDRAAIVHQAFLDKCASGSLPHGPGPGEIDPRLLRPLFEAQALSRQLDRTSRAMQAAGEGFYTIGSSGHEGMAAIAAALRPTDMAFLHYRDAAFQIARAAQVPGQTPMRDILLSFAASSDDPISGGRHKVLGSRALNIPPQTSTIASHLPKAVGAAYALGLARRAAPEHRAMESDGIVLCSFGDASSNHASAQAAINTACWTAFQNAPLPLVFVCEDNGIGISTPTPEGWVAANFANRPGLTYISCDGLHLGDTYRAATRAAEIARRKRKPVFLHMRTVRLYGHAGSDVEAAYRDRAATEADEANDPLLHSVRLLAEAGVMTSQEAATRYAEIGAACEATRAEVVTRPRLQSAADVMASIVPPKRACARPNTPSPNARATTFGEADLRAMESPQPMNRHISWALTDLMLQHGEVVLAGEDVGRKGGVYGATAKVQSRFGPDRVIDTLLDETSILGLAIGLGHNGFVPIPEIQFLAYLHNAEDQLRGEAATLSFFSNGQYTNPMVLRIAGLGYQRGFGGHFHNDNSLAVLRDIPGLIIACPSQGADAAMMLREAVRLAREEQRVVVFVEPIALYPMKDLHDAGDGGWLTRYPAPDKRIALGEVGVTGEGTDLAIVTYGNGHLLSRQALPELTQAGIATRVIDLRWLAPLPFEAMLEAIGESARVLIVDECRGTGGQAAEIMAALTEAGHPKVARDVAEDSFIATGPAYATTMPSKASIIAAAKRLVEG
ncbi:dehydrogenase E1 component subunit alpha/beta [Roseobacteraceae bacterium S113]